jgi:uncharacterized protein YbaR (Trm112 family)
LFWPTVLIVRRLIGASPLNRLSMLAPPSARSPLPVDSRRSISRASAGWFETSSRRCSFSYQRKAGIPSLLPRRRPAWLAEVCEGRSAVHSIIRWLPLRIQRDSVGRLPARTCAMSSGAARPSIWMNTTPGTSLGACFTSSRMTCATTRAENESSSDMPMIPDSSVSTAP